MAKNPVFTLASDNGLPLSTTDNGDGTATLDTTGGGGGGGVASSVAIKDGSTTQKATVTVGGAVVVDGSAATQPVSAASLPLPTGAATAAKQPALGTAGAAAADVLTVQGIASMTALKTDGSGVTQPVSAASLPLPAGAATAAKQPALGTAGAAAADVLTVQGVASMTAIKVDGSGVTQPVSGTVTMTATAATTVSTTLTGSPPASQVIAATAKDYRGFTLRETAGSTAVVVLWDNASAASGTILEEITLAANESAREYYTAGGVKTLNGIFCQIVSGQVAGSVRTI